MDYTVHLKGCWDIQRWWHVKVKSLFNQSEHSGYAVPNASSVGIKTQVPALEEPVTCLWATLPTPLYFGLCTSSCIWAWVLFLTKEHNDMYVGWGCPDHLCMMSSRSCPRYCSNQPRGMWLAGHFADEKTSSRGYLLKIKVSECGHTDLNSWLNCNTWQFFLLISKETNGETWSIRNTAPLLSWLNKTEENDCIEQRS